MKTPVPPPYRLGELRERVIASLANADDERHLFVLRALAGGLDDPEYRPWEYYFRAEPVPEVVVRRAYCARLDGPAHSLCHDGRDAPDVQSPRSLLAVE